MNLYNKYRPQDFDDVVGQDYTVKILKNQIAQNKISSAYLLEGSRGCGKTTVARLLAKACNECEHCGEIDNTLDIVEIDAASNNGVDNIRELIDICKYVPSMKYKVFIVDEVHMLSTGAFNALLKTLEEPPAHVIFILCTTEKHKLPATVLSRCQQFTFRLISLEDMVCRMKYVCEKENVRATNEALTLIAKCANGAMRDALSILDKCLSFTNTNELTEEQVKEIVGISDSFSIIKLLEYLLNRDITALELFSELSAVSTAQQVLSQLQTVVRDLMLLQVSSGNGRKVINTAEYIETLNGLKGKVVDNMLSYMLKKIISSMAEMKNTTNADMVMEALIVDIVNYEAIDISEISIVIKQLQKEIKELKANKSIVVERTIESINFKNISVADALKGGELSEEETEVIENEAIEEEELTEEDVVEKLSRGNIFLYSMLRSSEIKIAEEVSITVFDIGAYVALKSYLKNMLNKPVWVCYTNNATAI